jgi:hypothetical protein
MWVAVSLMDGATTLRRMTLGIMTLGRMTLGIMTLAVLKLSIITELQEIHVLFSVAN